MTATTQPRFSRRLVLGLVAAALLSGSAAVATSASADDHVTCVINQDRSPDAQQHGLCVILPDPDLR